jgi:exopolysaccharide biosynthesis polyprenyl glycosylphosphotransferase
MLFLALLVRASSPGPVLFKQERMGLGGRPFTLLKFRTMRVDAERETGPVWAKDDDPRCTRVGSWMRRVSLDELPQFVNVLRGEMSLVGPRPERPHFVQQFTQDLPAYMLRHNVKAGVTGWAQVNGLRGNTSLTKRLEYDLYYINHWSLAFDALILFLTPFMGFFNRNAH